MFPAYKLFLLLILSLGISAARATASTDATVEDSCTLLVADPTVTGVVGGIHYEGGNIDRFTVTKADGTVVTIVLQPPDPGTNGPILAYDGKKATVEYHLNGVPAVNVYDAIGPP